MQKQKILLGLVMGMVLVGADARAEIWQTAKTLKTGRLSVGGYGQLYLDPSEFMAVGQATYGVAPNVQIEGRLGLGSLDPLLGFYGKYQFKPFPLGAFAIWGGFQTFNSFWALQFAPIWSVGLEQIDLYVSPLISFPLEDGPDTSVALVPGLTVPIAKAWSFYGEVHLNLTNTFNAVSAGARYFFD